MNTTVTAVDEVIGDWWNPIERGVNFTEMYDALAVIIPVIDIRDEHPDCQKYLRKNFEVIDNMINLTSRKTAV